MGQLLYLSAMKNTDIVIGNSSSGIVEAPAFHKPTINIGMRQQGRLKAESILDCEENEQKIVEAIRRGLSDEFKKIAENAENPYGSGNASFRIKEYLKNASLTNILMKKFYEAGNG
jgi:GDP/UDP-N,N'-diacetylbacillosamine 2-epimerase (hydrolysing)